MALHNITIVLAPNLFPALQGGGGLLDASVMIENQIMSAVVLKMLENYHALFLYDEA